MTQEEQAGKGAPDWAPHLKIIKETILFDGESLYGPNKQCWYIRTWENHTLRYSTDPSHIDIYSPDGIEIATIYLPPRILKQMT